jgi:hypothetical protein
MLGGRDAPVKHLAASHRGGTCAIPLAPLRLFARASPQASGVTIGASEAHMSNKLQSFLSENKIDQRRLIATSRNIERLRAGDRAIKLKQSQARKSEDAKKPEGLDKPRTGRPITDVGLRRALAGDKVPGPQKTRILRAINALLEKGKKDPVGIHQLFDVTAINAPKPKAEEPAEAES